ncbi:MAG: PD-(D/E)XK nuclease-like domain-containing protein [Gaiellaceae bacterium]
MIELSTDGGAVVRDLDHEEYTRHPALSASGAKTLVQPGGPARYAYERDNGRPPKDAYDLGTAAHNAVLGVGPDLAVLTFLDWRTKEARQAREEARAAGRVPLLVDDAQRVADMAAALQQHPIASRLLHPDTGEPEVSLFWRDPEHDVDRRARVDWLRRPDPDGRLILVDYKTTSTGAAPADFARSVARYGYAQQAAWYADLVVGLGLARSAPFVFIAQETTAPYLVSVVQLDEPAMEAGRALNRKAMRLFRQCTDSGVWPGLTEDEIATISLPPWALSAAYEDEPW